MGHRLAPEAETDLDSIWHYIATESGSVDVADRVVDSITRRFSLLENRLFMVARAMTIFVPAFAHFQLASMSSPIESRTTTSGSCGCFEAVKTSKRSWAAKHQDAVRCGGDHATEARIFSLRHEGRKQTAAYSGRSSTD